MGHAIYEPKGAAYEYGRWACNLYNGCSNKCDYCYNRHCPQSGTLGGDVVTLKKSLKNPEHAFEIFKKELDQYKERMIKEGGLFFSFVSDPMIPETRELTMKCATYAMENGVRVTILTKDAKFSKEDVEWMVEHREFIAIGFTVTGMDEMEHGRSNTQERIAMAKKIHDSGVHTWASIEPVIDMEKALDVIKQSPFVFQFLKIGLASKVGLRFDSEQVQRFVDRGHEESVGTDLYATPIYWKESVRKHLPDGFVYRWPNSVSHTFDIFSMELPVKREVTW